MTYAKNPKKKWYCYNDSSCKVGESRELISGGTRARSWDVRLCVRGGIPGHYFLIFPRLSVGLTFRRSGLAVMLTTCACTSR